jgi:hypothetical protein
MTTAETLTPETLAALLNGRAYRQEITKEEQQAAYRAGLVVVFGASDDLMESRGALEEEVGAWEGTTVRVTAAGLLPRWDSVDHDDEAECESYFRLKLQHSVEIKALWCKDKTWTWTYETSIPHATFEIMDEDEHYCRGIVFRLADVRKAG